MVFLSHTFLARNPGPSAFWRKRRIFKMSAHFVGRKRNCYSVAVRYVHRALRYATLARRLRMNDLNKLYATRVQNAAEEVGLSHTAFSEGLGRSEVLLTNRSLADLAIWEPRSFKALANFAWHRSVEEGLNGMEQLGDPPKGVILRGMLKK